MIDNREASEALKIREVGDAWGGRHMGGSRNSVNDDLHRETAGNRGTVGGATSTI